MTAKLPGKDIPNPIRPKRIMSVSKRGHMTTASVVSHPAAVERIAFVHREAQAKMRDIMRKIPGKGPLKGLR